MDTRLSPNQIRYSFCTLFHFSYIYPNREESNDLSLRQLVC
jgi:hypothetical protein